MTAVCNDDSGNVRGAVSWLSLAAAPSFALMALVTGLAPPAPMMNCSAMSDVAPSGILSLGGMVPMYLLMSLFHAVPWIRLLKAIRRGGQSVAGAPAGSPAG